MEGSPGPGGERSLGGDAQVHSKTDINQVKACMRAALIGVYYALDYTSEEDNEGNLSNPEKSGVTVFANI